MLLAGNVAAKSSNSIVGDEMMRTAGSGWGNAPHPQRQVLSLVYRDSSESGALSRWQCGQPAGFSAVRAC
jgi:hypothetical protein